mgnify:CR=1 FL=1
MTVAGQKQTACVVLRGAQNTDFGAQTNGICFAPCDRKTNRAEVWGKHGRHGKIAMGLLSI